MGNTKRPRGGDNHVAWFMRQSSLGWIRPRDYLSLTWLFSFPCSTSSLIGFSSLNNSIYRISLIGKALRTLTSDICEVSQKMAGPRLSNSHHLLGPLRCLSSDSSQVLTWTLFSSTLFPVVSGSVPGAELDSSAASLQELLLPNSFNKGSRNSNCTALGYLPFSKSVSADGGGGEG